MISSASEWGMFSRKKVAGAIGLRNDWLQDEKVPQKKFSEEELNVQIIESFEEISVKNTRKYFSS